MIFRRSTRDQVGQLLEEIDALTNANREGSDPEIERRLVDLRHRAALQLLNSSRNAPSYPDPAFDRLPARNGELPAIAPEELTPELVRAGVLRDGCLLVRGLIDRAEAEQLVEEIGRAFESRDAVAAGRNGEPGYYDELEPDPRFEGFTAREFVSGGGGLWVADSPHVLFRMLDLFERSGLRKTIQGYLDEPPVISVQKCTLRKVDPAEHSGRGWHQDGAFMGDVRALNVWLSLSRCGDESPGLEIVPRRLDHIVPTGTEGAVFDWSVSPQVAEEAAADAGILRPIFEPGDVLLFDDLFLHTTASEPDMTKSRWAIESWFFGSSASPEDYAPLAA